jgi:hypothetical protein
VTWDGLPGYDAWKTSPPDDCDDVDGDVVLAIWRQRPDDDGVLCDCVMRVEVRVRSGEVTESTDEETGESVELTQDEEGEAVYMAGATDEREDENV